MPGLIGRKIGMTSVFSADGKNVPCTVIEAGPPSSSVSARLRRNVLPKP